jgi:hypothetical protein
MVDTYNFEMESQRAQSHHADQEGKQSSEPECEARVPGEGQGEPDARNLEWTPVPVEPTKLSGKPNSPVRAATIQRMQETHGNRATHRFVQRGSPQGETAAEGGDSWWMSMFKKAGVTSKPDRDEPQSEGLLGPTLKVAGDANNVVGAGTAVTKTVADAALWGKLMPDLLPHSPVAKMVSNLPGADWLAGLSDNLTPLGKGLGLLDNVSDVLGTGIGLLQFATANTTEERVQAGADTAASIAGFLGPIGRAFSGGYDVGQLMDKNISWTDTDVHGNPTKDSSLSKMVGEGWYDILDSPGGFGGALSDMGEFIWEGTHDKGGIKGVASDLTTGLGGTIEKYVKEQELAAKRRAEIEHEKDLEMERKREIQSRLYNITSGAALGGAEVSPDDVATRIGQDRRLQLLLKLKGQCYE